MRVLLLGGTGSIGGAVLDELIAAGHSVLALARRSQAASHVTGQGAEALEGDIRHPRQWVRSLHDVDAMVHAAATFSDDMGEVDRHLIETLIQEGRNLPRPLRFIYTGGVWLYGETGARIAHETCPLKPIPAYRWLLENYELLSQANCFAANIIHPAMVYQRSGGAIGRFIAEAKEVGHIEIWGTPETRWPLVHRRDLASAYRLVLDQAPAGEAYNVAAQQGVNVTEIAQAIAKRFGSDVSISHLSRDRAIEAHGSGAEGPTLDQQMSSDKIRRSLGWHPPDHRCPGRDRPALALGFLKSATEKSSMLHSGTYRG